jgi:hypothetical protein
MENIENKNKNFKSKVVVILICFMAIASMAGLSRISPNFFSGAKEIINYTFILDNETMESIMVCEDLWHYELIENTIPCVINDTIGGINGETLDWKISPQENCQSLGGFFPGLNLVNDTRAKELYDELLPKCFELKSSEVTDIWLNASNCKCLEDNDPCFSFDCGGGLFVFGKSEDR